jgi:hypothetical protein
MKLIRVLLVSLVLGITTGTTVGCASWLAQFEANPVAVVNTIIAGVQSVLSIATQIWNAIFPLLPVNSQPQAQTDWNNAVMSLNLAIQAAQDAAIAAQDGKTNNWPAALGALGQAADAIEAIIKQYEQLLSGGTTGLKALPPTHIDTLHQSITRLHNQINAAPR